LCISDVCFKCHVWSENAVILAELNNKEQNFSRLYMLNDWDFLSKIGGKKNIRITSDEKL